MKHVLALAAASVLFAGACSDSTVATPVTENADGGTPSGAVVTCADTGFNPDPCTTEAGHTYSFLQNAGSGGTFEVGANATMDFNLNGGGAVTIDCKAGSTCDVTINGGSATVTCAATASCSVSCNGGTGTLTCSTGTASCRLDQNGGRCVQS